MMYATMLIESHLHYLFICESDKTLIHLFLVVFVVVLAVMLFFLLLIIQKSIITTFAGTGTAGSSGDGGAATSAQLNHPQGLSVDKSGNVYIADYANNKIRMVTSTGIITTIAGTGTAGRSGDGGAATSAQLSGPRGVSVGVSGNVYIADSDNNKIRMVTSTGTITTFAGTGVQGTSDDGGAATSAQLYSPFWVSVGMSGNVYIADTNNLKIRMVTSTGIITTIAGTGTYGSNGDGGAATSAQLYYPYGISVDISGNLYIADYVNNKIRMVTSTGIIITFAGTGAYGTSGDGGAATSAQLAGPMGVSVDISGNVYTAEYGNLRIRMVTSAGIITTFAGTGVQGTSGDGGAATSAQFYDPAAVSVDISGNVYVADFNAAKIRVVKPACSAGSYMSGSTCLLCIAGTYNPTIGATTASACVTCPVSYVSQSGASQCTTTPPTPVPTPAPSYEPGSPTPIPTVGAAVSPSSPQLTVKCTQVFINPNIVSQETNKFIGFTLPLELLFVSLID